MLWPNFKLQKLAVISQHAAVGFVAASLLACGGTTDDLSSAGFSSTPVNSSSSVPKSSLAVSSSVAAVSSTPVISSSSMVAVSSASSSTPAATMNTVVIQESAKGFCAFDGALATEHAGFGGAGFVDTTNENGAKISWQLGSSSNQTVTVKVRYGNGKATNRPASFTVNGAAAVNANFAYTTEWANWTDETVSLNLKSGTNTITLTATSAEGLANVDSISVTGNGVSADNCPPMPAVMATNKWFAVVNRANNLVFAIQDKSTTGGALLTQAAKVNADNQLFRFVDSGDNFYRLRAKNSDLALDVLDFNTDDGADIIQWEDLDGDNQQFHILDLHNGYFQIVNNLTQKALAPEYNSNAPGSRISQYTPDVNNQSQHWQLVAVSDYSLPTGGIFKPKYRLGADITHTMEYEAGGWKYYDGGQQKGVLRIFADHGFNFIRMRTFVCPTCKKDNPTHEKDVGYAYLTWQNSGAPLDEWAGTEKTIELAKRVKACKMGVFLDFHLSDTWTSIGFQFVAKSWMGKNLEAESYKHAKDVMTRMTAAGVKPDMVQCGNENNSKVAGVSVTGQTGRAVINACMRAVRETDPNIPVVIHHGQPRPDKNFDDWVNNLLGSQPVIDTDAVCGSTYGTTNNGADWRDMFGLVVQKYNKAVLSCEYTNARRDLVNDTFINMPNGKGWGSFLWEPTVYPDSKDTLFTRGSKRFDANANMDAYVNVAKKAGLPVPATPAAELDASGCK